MIAREVVGSVTRPVAKPVTDRGQEPQKDERTLIAAFDRGGYYIKPQQAEE